MRDRWRCRCKLLFRFLLHCFSLWRCSCIVVLHRRLRTRAPPPPPHSSIQGTSFTDAKTPISPHPSFPLIWLCFQCHWSDWFCPATSLEWMHIHFHPCCVHFWLTCIVLVVARSQRRDLQCSAERRDYKFWYCVTESRCIWIKSKPTASCSIFLGKPKTLFQVSSIWLQSRTISEQVYYMSPELKWVASAVRLTNLCG